MRLSVPLWPAAERAGMPVALAAALFLPTVGQIASRHPGLKLIVDHMAVPPGSRGESAYRFQPELLALAKYPTGRRTLFPEMNLSIGDQHLAYPFDPKIFSCSRIRRSLKSADSPQSGFRKGRFRRALSGHLEHGAALFVGQPGLRNFST
jgi:hypothetical protein